MGGAFAVGLFGRVARLRFGRRLAPLLPLTCRYTVLYLRGRTREPRTRLIRARYTTDRQSQSNAHESRRSRSKPERGGIFYTEPTTVGPDMDNGSGRADRRHTPQKPARSYNC